MTTTVYKYICKYICTYKYLYTRGETEGESLARFSQTVGAWCHVFYFGHVLTISDKRPTTTHFKLSSLATHKSGLYISARLRYIKRYKTVSLLTDSSHPLHGILQTFCLSDKAPYPKYCRWSFFAAYSVSMSAPDGQLLSCAQTEMFVCGSLLSS